MSLKPYCCDFKGGLLNQICSHPIIDCSLHLDKSYSRDGEGDRGIETERERAGNGCESVAYSHRLNLSF